VISKSKGCNVRVWDLSVNIKAGDGKSPDKAAEKTAGDTAGTAQPTPLVKFVNPPHRDITNTNDALAVCNRYAVGGSDHLVLSDIDGSTDSQWLNRMEVPLPAGIPFASQAGAAGGGSRRRRALKTVREACSTEDGAHMMISCSDGSLLYHHSPTGVDTPTNGGSSALYTEPSTLAQFSSGEEGPHGQPLCIAVAYVAGENAAVVVTATDGEVPEGNSEGGIHPGLPMLYVRTLGECAAFATMRHNQEGAFPGSVHSSGGQRGSGRKGASTHNNKAKKQPVKRNSPGSHSSVGAAQASKKKKQTNTTVHSSPQQSPYVEVDSDDGHSPPKKQRHKQAHARTVNGGVGAWGRGAGGISEWKVQEPLPYHTHYFNQVTPPVYSSYNSQGLLEHSQAPPVQLSVTPQVAARVAHTVASDALIDASWAADTAAIAAQGAVQRAKVACSYASSIATVLGSGGAEATYFEHGW
jgi:hypothetical protein